MTQHVRDWRLDPATGDRRTGTTAMCGEPIGVARAFASLDFLDFVPAGAVSHLEPPRLCPGCAEAIIALVQKASGVTVQE